MPRGEALDDDDRALIAAAEKVLRQHYRPSWHVVSAAIRGRDGRVWTGIHLGATVGRLQICAEAVALGRLVLEGDGIAERIVAVRHPKPEETIREMAVVSPCGGCREMLLDHAPNVWVILPEGKGLARRPVRELLPAPYRR